MQEQQQPSKFPLRFVITDPASKTDRSETIRDVRSHAGRWRWRQTRNSRHSKPGPKEDAVVQRSLLSEPSEPSEPPEPLIWRSTTAAGTGQEPHEAGSSSATVPVVHALNTGFVDSSGPVDNYQQFPGVWGSPGANMLDPYQTHVPSSLLREAVSTNNKYSLSVLWPGMMPGLSNGANHPGVRAWFSLSMSDSALHSSMFFGACSHRRMQWKVKRLGYFSSKDAMQLMHAEADSISKINLAIQNPSKATSDATILSVLCLATNHSPLEQQPKPSPFQPPLRRLQWLDVYGSLLPNPVHQAGLVSLIEIRGGLDKLELPGLAAVISYSDVLGASRSLSRPRFPFIGLQTNTPSLGQNLRWCNEHYTNSIDFDPSLSLEMTSEMYRTFHAARAYTTLIERLLDGVHIGVQSALLCDSRNFVQWHIMSLLPASQLGAVSPQVMQIYEPCRLALVIFGIGVIFPLPPEPARSLKLVRLLQLELQMCANSSMRLTSTETGMRLRCWCLVLGGIAATGTVERKWFVGELKRFSEEHTITTWDEVRTIMRSILWFDVACNAAGEELWREVVDLASIGHG